jgi:hypothetical protein
MRARITTGFRTEEVEYEGFGSCVLTWRDGGG